MMKLAPVLGWTALLSACLGTTVFEPDRVVDDLDSFLRYAAPQGEAQLDIVGAPFPTDGDALAQAVIAGFERGVRHGPRLRFSTHSKSARPGHRFLLVFGAERETKADDLCQMAGREPLPFTNPPSPKAKAVFCVGARAYSETSGQTGEIANVGDPGFELWARNMMFSLTPPPDPKAVLEF